MTKAPPPKRKPLSSREKVRAHRTKLRKQGLKPVQIWVPDVHSEEFKREARRQSLAIANSPQEKEDIAWLESLLSEIDWDDP